MAFRSPQKRRFAELQSDLGGKVYKFRILLPNGTSTGLTLHEPNDEMLLKEFVYFIRKEFMKTGSGIPETKRLIKWDGDIYLEDMFEKEIRKRISFSQFEPNKLYILRLHDGLNEAVNTFENMWDLTPVTELLSEFPSEYTFETSLADLIDNSLQAVWSNGPGERRLICVRVDKNKISIFDTGPGMDCSDDNSIVKWGRMGSSNHRASRPQAVGGSPPYLMPFFGMFGYGGPVAAMHLGRRAIVSSKSKKSRKVYTLLFEREALISKSGSDWRTNGGIRDPLESEMEMSPHGSFTKVKILEPKLKCLEPFQLQCRLKDIYFPYIQCDDVFDTGKTMTPIEFQVNGINLAEIEGGEVATTNLHSCNGPEFVLQVKFQIKKDAASSRNPGSPFEANARLKCVYFPISEGQESFERILEKLNAEGCKIEENFEKFSRVSIRRLGRLLPDARWAMLPFMDMKLKKGDKAQVLKRCCWRVKCFIDADAGFCPTPSKTDLAHHDPYTVALKNFGNKTFSKESGGLYFYSFISSNAFYNYNLFRVFFLLGCYGLSYPSYIIVEIAIIIRKGGKPSSPSQVEKDYIDWVLKMHEEYDEEIDRGEDQPVLVVNPSNKKALGISSDVVRVHQVISRKGVLWKSGQNIKILKGAVGCHKNNLYATLEFILLEGFQGDVGGEARLICRPLGCSKENGCMLKVDGDSASLDIQDALSFPISVIDSGKCQLVDAVAWNSQLDRREQQKVPCIVTILSAEQCHQLQIDGELPIDAPIFAGRLAPEKVVAVIRPASCTSSSSPVLDQKYIIVDDLGMSLEIKYGNESKNFKDAEIIAAETLNVSSHRGVQGLYIFPLRSKFPRLFHRAGTYFFSLSVISADSSYKNWEAQVLVQPSPAVKWGLKSDIFADDKSVVVRIGERIPRLSIICFDVYHNCVPFTRIHGVNVKIKTKDGSVLLQIDKISADLSLNKMTLEIKDLLIETSKVDLIRPSYYATLEVSSLDNLFSVTASCKVFPGGLHSVRMKETLKPESELVPGSLIEELCLEVLDIFGNHVEKGVVINLMVDGLHFMDNAGSIDSIRQVDDQGNVNLSGLLKVTQRYGGTVHLYVYSGGTKIWEKQFRVTERQLRVASGVPGSCAAGSVLENVVFEIVDYGGIVDEKIHGQFHTLAITSDSSNISDTVRYIFQHGKCRVPILPVPQGQSRFCFAAFHSGHPELHIDIEILVIQTPKLEIVPLTEPDTNLVISPCSDHRVLASPSSTPCSPNEIRSLGHFLMSDQMELEKSLGKVRLHVETHKSKLQLLYEQNGSIQREIYDLQASAKTQQLGKFDCLMNAKEQIVQNIKQKGDTAAAVLCQLIQLPQKHLMKDVVDLVALLGTVSSIRLSRILAEYLGEDLMLAVVCMSFEAANAIERYCENGNIDRTFGLYEVACKLGRTIKGRYTGICLEHIRPFKGGFKGNDPQRKLILPDPILTPGKIPPGFMGYAVNLIDLDIQHLNTRTKAGYGLRETLFYHLFNEVQVYRTREDMKRANVCIKSGAVSLDGGIIKGNCVIAFGDCLSREPKIIFPVVKPEVPRHLSKNCGELVTKISTKMAELESVRVEIAEEEEAYDRSLIKYSKIEKKFQKFIREKGPFLSGFVLDYKADII